MQIQVGDTVCFQLSQCERRISGTVAEVNDLTLRVAYEGPSFNGWSHITRESVISVNGKEVKQKANRKPVQTQLQNVNCYCYEASDQWHWSTRRILIVTTDESKAIAYMDEFCKRHSDETETWSYRASDIQNSQGLMAKVIL